MYYKNYVVAFAIVVFLIGASIAPVAQAYEQKQAKSLLYDYRIVAKSEATDFFGRRIADINGHVSLNDNGAVVFKGATAGTGVSDSTLFRENLFVVGIGGDYGNIRPLLDPDPYYELIRGSYPSQPNTQRFGVPQINNNNIVLAPRTLGVQYLTNFPFGPLYEGTFFYLEKWNALLNGFPIEMVVFGDAAVGPALPLMYFTQPNYALACGPFLPNFCFLKSIANWKWAAVSTAQGKRYHSISNSGLTSFAPLNKAATTWFLSTLFEGGDYHLGDVYNEIASNPGPVWSSIADNGLIIAKDGTYSNNSIKLFDYNLINPESISDGSFTTTGFKPGISDDGSIIVFAGNRGNGNAIFASIKQPNGTRYTDRIAGESIRPPAAPELGMDDNASNPNPIYFRDFDIDSPVAVIHYDLGETGSLKDDSFVVAFIATPSGRSPATFFTPGIKFSDQKGLWTVRVDLTENNGSFGFNIHRPLPVIQIGDEIPGQSAFGAVSEIIIDDPLAKINGLQPPQGLNLSEKTQQELKAGSHQIAFGVKNAAGDQAIVLASHKNSCIIPVRRIPQGGQTWSSKKLDCSPAHNQIGPKGCVLTTMSMQLSTIAAKLNPAKTTNPGNLNDFLQEYRRRT